MRRNKDVKIVLNTRKVITRSQLFKRKNNFHKEQARLPFEEKIKILVQLQKIANEFKKSSRHKKWIWRISFK